MKTKVRTSTMALSVAGLLLFSGVFLATDAFAQVRGGRVTVPHGSTGVRGGGGLPFGGQGLKAVGSLLGSAGGGHYGHDSHHDRYSNAEAFRDVGLANAAVGLVGTLVNGYGYPQYPSVVAAPVAVVPVPAPYPVAVVSSPRVVVSSYPYGYGPSYYPYSSYYGYGSPYYSPSTVWNAPCGYPYGYYDGYGCGTSYYNSPRVYSAPLGTGYYPEHHGVQYYDGNHRQSGSWQTDRGGSYRQPGSWQNGHGAAQAPTYHGPSVQAPTSAYHGGSAPGFSGAHGGGHSQQQTGMHSAGRSYRIR